MSFRLRQSLLLPPAGLAISAVATFLLLRAHGDRAISLLIFLPGIVLAEYLFGLWAALPAMAVSVLGSVWYRTYFLPPPPLRGGFVATWEEEIILLAVGLFVIWLMELRRRSGEAAANGASQFASLLDNIADAALIFDRGLRVARFSPATLALLDCPPEALAGQPVAAIRRHFQFTSGEMDRLPLEEALLSGLASRHEGTIVDRFGARRVHVIASVTPLRDTRRHIVGILVVFTDVTSLKEMQTRILDNARHLAIAQMTAGLTHDFNHVLDIIRRAAAVLEIKENEPAEQRRKYREMIDQAAVNGATIVRRLRDYLAGGAGELSLVDFNALAAEAMELTRPLWRSRAEIEVVEDFHPLPPVHGNPGDLRRVLVNLIFNAVEALGAKGGRVEIHTEADADTVRCWVADTGPGIAADAQSRLFQPYFTTKAQGMGMGLFGAQKIVLAHGGNLTFFTQPGSGTRFNIELPALARGEAA